MKKRFSILLLLLTICFMTSHAQQMPITVTPILTPPYTPSLSKMCESGSTSLMVNVFVNDVTASDIQLRLHLKLESTGITIESVSKAPVRPISVGGGEARVLMGSDLADVLSLNNLTFKGYDKAAYIKTGALPGGVWRLTAWLEHYHTGRILSNKGTAMAVIASYPPPVLTSPKNNEVTTGDMSKPIVFTWNASKFMGGTASLLYTLEMWEMHTDGVPAEAVVASQSPIYTSAPTAGLSHTLIPTSLAMEPGRKYCWRVTVSDPSGKAHIQNGGRSEVRVFQYLEKCPDICEINVTVRDVTATATWDVDTRHKGGWNVEMYDDAGTYHETLWTGNNNTGEQIFDYGTKWHVRVQGICQGGQVSAWSEWKDFQIAERFTTPKRDDGTPYECGEFAEPRVITNMEEKELKKGDIIENERGTTKYEIYSATRNDDGSYRGLSYIILSIWNCKVLGEYDNLRVNTDGVNISNFSWRSKKSDLLMADPDAIRQWTEELAKDIAGATYNNTIKETIKLDDVSFETIVRKDGKYYAVVKTETGEIEEVDITYSVDGKKRVAIEGKDGKQLVVDKNGEMMGVEEYKYCGGSKILLNENMKEKDAKIAKSGNVYFSQYGDDYLFDSYEKYQNHSAADGYAKRFPSIGEGNYRPAYACAESKSEIQILAEPYKTYTFKNERGVPVICKDGILTVSARGDRDTTSIYAYDYDGQVVGKVNVMSYDKVTRKVCLVPVGNAVAPDAAKIKTKLDEQFAKLMVDFEVTIGEKIDIEYKDPSRGFIHGGSGLIGVYNKDQESAISKLKEKIKIDDETCYLFLVECSGKNQLDENDKQTRKTVAGYMPRAYQFGFIYNQYDNIRTIAHELSHGAFHLKHTFAEGDDYIAPEHSTDNLMDYAGGETLNHWQWQDVHLPKSVRFKWAQDEAGAEYTVKSFFEPIYDYIGNIKVESMCWKYLDDLEKAKKENKPNPIENVDDYRNKYSLFNDYEINLFKWIIADIDVLQKRIRNIRNSRVNKEETDFLEGFIIVSKKLMENPLDIDKESFNYRMCLRHSMAERYRAEPLIAFMEISIDYFKVLSIASSANVLKAFGASSSLQTCLRSYYKKCGKEFVSGGIVSDLGYILGQKISGEQINYEDLAYHFFIGGCSNVCNKKNKLLTLTLTCLDGIDLVDVADCVLSSSDDTKKCNVAKMAAGCGAGIAFDYAMKIPKIKNKIDVLKTKSKKIIIDISRSASLGSPKAELIFFQNICGLPEDWASKRISTIEKYGEEGFNLLKELKIDYSSMGPDAFEMLSLCVKNASKESINKLKAVLSNTQIDWVNKFLKKRIKNKSVDEIAVEIEKIYTKSGSVKVSMDGKIVSVQTLLNELNQHFVEYYYKKNSASSLGILIKNNTNVFVEFTFKGSETLVVAYPNEKVKSVLESWLKEIDLEK